MPDIRFACVNCGKHLVVDQAGAGLSVKCPDCGNEQLTFEKAASIVKCNICDGVLAEPTGGKTKVRGEITEILE